MASEWCTSIVVKQIYLMNLVFFFYPGLLPARTFHQQTQPRLSPESKKSWHLLQGKVAGFIGIFTGFDGKVAGLAGNFVVL